MQKAYSSHGFCILNAFGDVWTHEWFSTEHAAKWYMHKVKCDNPTWDLSKHTIVPARHTIFPKRPTPTHRRTSR